MFATSDHVLAEYAARHHGVFSLADARAAGMTAGQVDWRVTHAWQRVHEGVFRMPGAVVTWRSELLAACLAATAPAGVSHRSAAALYELPGGRYDLTEITCRRWKRTQKPGLVVHESTRWTTVDVTEIDGIPVSTPERVILELAGLRPYPDYVEAVIHAARRKRLVTYESTLETFRRLARRGVPGVRAMRAALDRWEPLANATESHAEIDLVQILREHGLPEPVAQFEILDDRGALVARVDAAFPEWRIAIEYDSKQEHSDEFQIARDARRRNQILAAGYLPLTARIGDLRNGGTTLVQEIRRIARRSAS